MVVKRYGSNVTELICVRVNALLPMGLETQCVEPSC
jgi:hypothetical protein